MLLCVFSLERTDTLETSDLLNTVCVCVCGNLQSVGSGCNLSVCGGRVVGGLWHLVTEVCHSESSSSQAGHQCREASLLSLTSPTDASNHTDAVLSLLILPNQEPGRFSLDSTAAASLALFGFFIYILILSSCFLTQ